MFWPADAPLFMIAAVGGRIEIEFHGFSILAELLDTPTARAIQGKLPFSSRVRRWGGEIYFTIPVDFETEPEAREVVEPGEVGYWPPGRAMALFFGPTPASVGQECRAASPVNVFARLTGDLKPLSAVPEGTRVSVRPVTS